MSDDDFDWSQAAIDVPHQAPITVYTNPDDHIVIRQDGDWYRRDDAWIVVLPENVPRLVETLLTLAGALARTEAAQLALPAPADRTAAERQRRYRQRKRDTVTAPCRDSGVTQRNANSGKDLFAAD